ncbi:hypothetical protein RRG08_057151 [Elysia crispata]|uniref:Uncharacterized protein n=1 Tax=Elysia crispata TaxID=231223 RepID=A0AAE1ARK8_9GAST|nr:hypothetical protein RRG08_057151 [Elysia crispata]
MSPRSLTVYNNLVGYRDSDMSPNWRGLSLFITIWLGIGTATCHPTGELLQQARRPVTINESQSAALPVSGSLYYCHSGLLPGRLAGMVWTKLLRVPQLKKATRITVSSPARCERPH